jgi:hypothetical protein
MAIEVSGLTKYYGDPSTGSGRALLEEVMRISVNKRGRSDE